MADKLVFQPVTINGRELIFRTPNAIQLAMLHRLSKVMDSASKQMDALKPAEGDDETSPEFREASTMGMEAMGKVLDLFASLVGPDVNEWLIDQMLTGKIGDEELLHLLDEIAPKKADTPKAPAKRARRTT